jgi:plasmid stabilization system protein ParE
MLDVIQSLALDDTQEAQRARESLDAKLDALAAHPLGKPTRETWGRLPAQQRAMRAAMHALD